MFKKIQYLLIVFFTIDVVESKCQGITADSIESKIQQVGDFLLYRDHDTTYVKSYSEFIGLKLVAVNKFNFFQVRDRNYQSKLLYRPEYGVTLGLGVAYKWFSIDLTFEAGIREDKDLETRQFFDVQTRAFTSKRLIEAHLQYYNAYELTRANGIDQNVSGENYVREDIRSMSFGLQYLFALNYDKFSLNASFVLNEKQRRSAGSPIFGASMVVFTMSSDSSIVPSVSKPYFNERLHLKDIGVISFAFSFGYMHTFIWKKHIFFTLGMIPGLNFNMGDTKAEDRDFFKWNMSYKLKTMNAVGYNSSRFFGGIHLVGDINNVDLKDKLSTQFSNGSIKFFAGYRFRKKVRSNKRRK